MKPVWNPLQNLCVRTLLSIRARNFMLVKVNRLINLFKQFENNVLEVITRRLHIVRVKVHFYYSFGRLLFAKHLLNCYILWAEINYTCTCLNCVNCCRIKKLSIQYQLENNCKQSMLLYVQ